MRSTVDLSMQSLGGVSDAEHCRQAPIGSPASLFSFAPSFVPSCRAPFAVKPMVPEG